MISNLMITFGNDLYDNGLTPLTETDFQEEFGPLLC